MKTQAVNGYFHSSGQRIYSMQSLGPYDYGLGGRRAGLQTAIQICARLAPTEEKEPSG